MPSRFSTTRYNSAVASSVLYWKNILLRALRNGFSRGVGLLLGLIVAAVTLIIQDAVGLIPNGSGPTRWLAMLAGVGVAFLLCMIGQTIHAVWQHHEEREKHLAILDASFEDYARLQAAKTLWRVLLRLRQLLTSLPDEFPLKNPRFKDSYAEYLALATADSFISVQQDARDPLPSEGQTDKNEERY